ncbi:MAG: hypothetical protein ABSE62_00525 [Chthoniobacteraceae bacterium]|jgi:hypothetical protein
MSKKKDDLHIAILELKAENLELLGKIYALETLVGFLLSSITGRSEKDIVTDLQMQEEKFHQRLLEKLENRNPALAALLDRRELSKIWLRESPAPNTPPPSG